jgi:hypothetical protein
MPLPPLPHARAQALAANAPGVGGEFFVATDGGAVFLWDSLDTAITGCGLRSLDLKFHLSEALLYPAAYACLAINWLKGGEPLRLSPFTVRMLTMHRHFSIEKLEQRLGYRPLRAFDEAWAESIAAVRQRLEADGTLKAKATAATPAAATAVTAVTAVTAATGGAAAAAAEVTKAASKAVTPRRATKKQA